MRLNYGLIVVDRLISRLDDISQQAGRPSRVEECVFDAKILRDLMGLRRANVQRWSEEYRKRKAEKGVKPGKRRKVSA